MLYNISEKHLATLKTLYVLTEPFLPECDTCNVSAELGDTETDSLND